MIDDIMSYFAIVDDGMWLWAMLDDEYDGRWGYVNAFVDNGMLE